MRLSDLIATRSRALNIADGEASDKVKVEVMGVNGKQ